MDAELIRHDLAVDDDKLDLLYERLRKAKAEGDYLKAASINLRIIELSERIKRRTEELQKAAE